MAETTVGGAVIDWLERRGVEVVFGIPGVHTVELYRGLGGSSIRHVTPRHEQGAGFMADGYARATGALGVAFVITGPGLTNALTAMAQARADSIPMLVVSAVNDVASLGRGLGALHELPDQHGLSSTVSVCSREVRAADEVAPALAAIDAHLDHGRPGPVHLAIAKDVLSHQLDGPIPTTSITAERIDGDAIERAAALLVGAKRPILITGGGSIAAADHIGRLAERLGAPVVQTVNARGQLHGHPLRIEASPSLDSVRSLLEQADVTLAIGTELGPTDFDMYETGTTARFGTLIRVDIDAAQLERVPAALTVCGRAEQIVPDLLARLGDGDLTADPNWGVTAADAVRVSARAELSPAYRQLVILVETIRDSLPRSIIVGDSTQPVYAANLWYGHDSDRGWFNSATGFGALGYAIPAAIGAALSAPHRPVVALTGDGGAQFSLPELMTAVDERLPIRFVVWNNRGYQEIADAMRAADAPVIGCDPTPPDFEAVAAACGIAYVRCAAEPDALAAALTRQPPPGGPVLIDVDA